MQKRWLGLPLAAFVAASTCGLALPVGIAACNTADLKQAGSSGGASGSSGEVPDDGETPGVDGGRDPVADLDGGVIPKSSNVSIQVQPSDLGKQIEAAIAGAETSVHMTMYLLTDSATMTSLCKLKSSGKDVKVVLNKTFPPNGGDNTESFGRLQQCGVSVVYAPAAYTFTHAKTVIIDSAKVLIMTMNLTYTSPKDNREYIATDSDPADVADCEKIFAADFVGNNVNVNGKLVVSPQSATPVDPRQRLKALIDSAKTSLDVEVQSLSDDTLTDAIILAHKDKVAVRVVLSGSNEQTPAQQESIDKMKAAGVPLKTVVKPYIHAKVIVVDGTTVFVGSQNFTPTALFQNREIGVVTDAPSEAAKVRDVIAQDYAAGISP